MNRKGEPDYRDDVWDGYTRVVNNQSGVLDIQPLEHGIWLVIEDETDTCSIGLSEKEIRELVSQLLMVLSTK